MQQNYEASMARRARLTAAASRAKSAPILVVPRTRARAAARAPSWIPTLIVRPARAVVHCSRSGHPDAQRAERGGAGTVFVADDRRGVPGRTADRVGVQIDVESVLGEAAAGGDGLLGLG